jgi:hypothetical protein
MYSIWKSHPWFSSNLDANLKTLWITQFKGMREQREGESEAQLGTTFEITFLLTLGAFLFWWLKGELHN